MKVRELIQALQGLDGDSEFVVATGHGTAGQWVSKVDKLGQDEEGKTIIFCEQVHRHVNGLGSRSRLKQSWQEKKVTMVRRNFR